MGVQAFQQSTAPGYGVSNVSYQTYEKINDVTWYDNGDGTTTVYVNIWTKTGKYPDFLNLWVDYNEDRDFIDSGEQIVDVDYYFFPIDNSTHIFVIPTPSDNTYIRAELGYYVDPEPVDEWLFGGVIDREIPEFSFMSALITLFGSTVLLFLIRKKAK